jgi:hypothetical protein
MKADDIKIGLVKCEEPGFMPYWKGFLIYKDTPVFEVKGDQMEGQYGDFIPLNFVKVEGEEEENTDEKKKADIGVLNIGSFKNKNGSGYTFYIKGIVELFGMKFPLEGFVAIKNEAKTCRLEFDSKTVDYYESDKYFQGCAEKQKDPIQLITFVNGIDYTDRDLEVMKQAYPDFEEWYETYIQSQRAKKITTNKKMVMPKKIEANAPY